MGKRKPLPKRVAKYGNRKVQHGGYKFDSVRECDRYKELCLLQEAGEITLLEVQPKFPLRCGDEDIRIRSDRYPNGRRSSYYADFAYRDERTGERVVEDVKGWDTAVSRLKRAIVEAQYGVQVTIVR